MNIALITLTENGGRIAADIQSRLPEFYKAKIFCFHKYPVSGGEVFDSVGVLTEKLWGNYDGLVFICACGIAVRSIAPFIRSKLTDPAIVAVDDSGRFAVSLLSGHIGGGNELAEIIGEIIGAVPVITTATDNRGRFSPDIFAKANGLVIGDMEAAKLIAAASLQGQMIGLYSDYPCRNNPSELIGDSGRFGICISSDASKKPFEATLNLIPKNIVVGVGCKKNTPPEVLHSHILKCLEDNGLSISGIRFLATVDIKENEPAILNFAEKYGIEMRTFSAEKLNLIKGDFSASEFVKSSVGTDNVCERSAAACGAKIIVPKTRGNGVTCAVGMLPFEADFERMIK
ncbi:MAG: cobalt-precorrin 5A hydrolase [Oscillospiraceae bacterium]|nr:cobalt-precorrin 5A hydrolase [Oscillospiraceae bacterium]